MKAKKICVNNNPRKREDTRDIYWFELGRNAGRKEIIEKLIELLDLDSRYQHNDFSAYPE